MSKVNMMSAKDKKKGSLVPRLRFPEFRDAGEWEEKPLIAVADYENGKAYEPHIIEGGRYIVVNSRFISTDGAIKKYSNEPICIAKRGDILMVLSDLPNGRALAKSYYVDADNLYAVNQRVCRLTPHSANGKFLCFLLDRHPNLLVFDDGKNQTHLKKNSVLQCLLKLPLSFDEQQRIADCLSSLDERIAAETSKLDTLKDHKKGLLKQLFPAEGETTPELRFPEFRDAGEWEEVPLSKLVSSLDAGVSVNAGDRPATSEEMGILKTSAVTNGVFEPQENKVVLDVVEIGRMRESVRRNTIIISRMNTPALVGANAYVDTNFENIFLPDRLWAAKPKPDTSMRFISFILSSNQGRATLALSAKGSSGSMKNITKSDVLAFLAMIPSLPEQQRIADCLSSLDELITAQTQKIDLLKEHRKGLMQQLFPRIDEVLA